jgi:hypothetical protein
MRNLRYDIWSSTRVQMQSSLSTKREYLAFLSLFGGGKPLSMNSFAENTLDSKVPFLPFQNLNNEWKTNI